LAVSRKNSLWIILSTEISSFLFREAWIANILSPLDVLISPAKSINKTRKWKIVFGRDFFFCCEHCVEVTNNTVNQPSNGRQLQMLVLALYASTCDCQKAATSVPKKLWNVDRCHHCDTVCRPLCPPESHGQAISHAQCAESMHQDFQLATLVGGARELATCTSPILRAREMLNHLAPLRLGHAIRAHFHSARRGGCAGTSAGTTNHSIVMAIVAPSTVLLPAEGIVALAIREADAAIVATAIHAPLVPAISTQGLQRAMSTAVKVGPLANAILPLAAPSPAEGAWIVAQR